MNFPCPPELAHLPAKTSQCSADSQLFEDAICNLLMDFSWVGHWLVPVSKRFWDKHAFRDGWGSLALESSRKMTFEVVRAALAAMGK